MLYFNALQHLHTHIHYLQSKLAQQDIFLVGGCIRDILLGITTHPTDIDITLQGNPQDIRDSMSFDKECMSRFRTEKYGTMTLLPKIPDYENIAYEITPFRTEGAYTDVRHPDDIQWSDNLFADSKRRDFSINCLYWYSIDSTVDIPGAQNTTHIHNISTLAQWLKEKKNIYIIDQQLYIIQDHTSINALFPQGKMDIDVLQNMAKEMIVLDSGENKHGHLSPSILIDPHGGCMDLLQYKLQTVGNPDDRFSEDALRILRGLRFPNILNQNIPGSEKQNHGFDIEKETRASMIQHAGLISGLAKERIYEELVKVFSAENPFGYICLLDEIGALDILFPELAACKGNDQPIRYHPFDTYTHTLLTLAALQDIFKGQDLSYPTYLANLAILYHDVGKPDQYAYIAEQKKKDPENIDMSGYTHHSETGTIIAQQAFANLGFSKKETEEIARYIRWHHRPGEILESNEKNRLKKMRKLLSEGGIERTNNLLDIAIADRRGQYNPLQPAAVEELYAMKEIIQELHENEGRFTIQELAVNGTDIMETYNIPAGPILGKMIKQCFDWVLGDIPKRNTKKKILAHAKTLL